MTNALKNAIFGICILFAKHGGEVAINKEDFLNWLDYEDLNLENAFNVANEIALGHAPEKIEMENAANEIANRYVHFWDDLPF